MAKGRTTRNKIRFQLESNMHNCEKMAARIEEVCQLYMEDAPDYCAFVSQLEEIIRMCWEAHKKVRDQV